MSEKVPSLSSISLVIKDDLSKNTVGVYGRPNEMKIELNWKKKWCQFYFLFADWYLANPRVTFFFKYSVLFSCVSSEFNTDSFIFEMNIINNFNCFPEKPRIISVKRGLKSKPLQDDRFEKIKMYY